ncbi:nucleotide pyrophosphohydrolase [Candidatus Bathyarchaeota archaeon]|nr:nucleotide pyrophosphohydrolase [Candidatus Bathyarchaeota archaeon]
MEISEFQKLLAERLGDKDKQMGASFLMNVLTEEVGELSRAIRKESKAEIGEEIADVLFSTMSIANVFGVAVEPLLVRKYVDRPLSDISRKWTDVSWR